MKEVKIDLNKQGIPVKKEDSNQFRAEQRRWKKDERDSRSQKSDSMSYWLKQSSCTAL